MLLEKKNAIVQGAGGGEGTPDPAVQDRHQRLPGLAAQPPATGAVAALDGRGPVAPALPGPAAGRPPTADGRQLPPGAGDTEFRAFKVDVLRIEGGRIAEITNFDATLFSEFGLPPSSDGPGQRLR